MPPLLPPFSLILPVDDDPVILELSIAALNDEWINNVLSMEDSRNLILGSCLTRYCIKIA